MPLKHPRAAAKRRYLDANYSANKRNIPFRFTFEEWDAWWIVHGIDKNFPTQVIGSQLCMCRHGDTGAYELNNVYVATRSQNTRDRNNNIGPHIAYGTANVRSKPCKTPLGVFVNRTEAAKAHNWCPQYMGKLLIDCVPGYHYL
jgi:hypothetical protein